MSSVLLMLLFFLLSRSRLFRLFVVAFVRVLSVEVDVWMISMG